ncbi:ABC transporter permease [Mycoplasmatota bacterium]|nr:ABC transporter permease [Mycoplasmatota bacterium]
MNDFIENITYYSVATLLIFFIIIIIINLRLKLNFSKKMIISIIRMFIQLSLVGLFLEYIFYLDKPYINALYLLLMICVASFTTVRNTKTTFKKFFIPIIIGLLITIFPLLLFFNYFVAKLDNLFLAQVFIPISGMLLGNSMNGSILAIDTFYKSIKNNEKEYFTSLSLAANRFEAIMPYFRNAVTTSTKQVIATMETIGIVALPGMMTGQILSGSSPMTAILYQIGIMMAIFVARYTTSIVVILLSMKNAFDEYDVLHL